MKIHDIEQYGNNQSAIRKYISKKDRYYQHEAIITVVKNGKYIYKNKLTVHAYIETNTSEVIISGDNIFEESYYLKYSAYYQNFSYYNYNLIISANNRLNEPIEIVIE